MPMSTHKKISFVKSTIRIFGYFVGMAAAGDNVTLFAAWMILAVSEVIGVIEELDEK